MIDHWTGVVFGWPFITAAAMLFGMGLARRQYGLILLGSLFAAPFCLYLGGTPRFGTMAHVVLLSNVAAAWPLARGWRGMSAALLVPCVALFVFVTVVLLREQ
jgi:hypothetical protein